MRRITRITIVVALFALLPMALLAQDEITLEGLAETVAGLTERIEAIEGLFADPWSPEIVYTDDGICQSPLHNSLDGFFSILSATIHQETADAYRSTYGISIDPSSVHLEGISFGVGSSHVYLKYSKDNREVVEKWAHCEFLGHSKWDE